MNFTIKTFYGIGSVIMIIATLGNIYSLYATWNFINWGARMSSLFGGVLFQMLISYFFYYLYTTTPDITSGPDLDKLMDEIQKGGKH
jgi:hypothetical protein